MALVEASERDRALAAGLAAMPARRREIFELARWDGLARAEIAALLDLSPQTVANQLALALAELRAAHHLFDVPDHFLPRPQGGAEAAGTVADDPAGLALGVPGGQD
ncbi:MAG: hypothetical protein FJ206_07720 [Gemmatimonadetes bacterium]|nr:hypothetical protein [Gemmatimonadota bacterium]